MATAKKNAKDYLVYKGRPLIRSGNVLYYGDMKDEYIIMLQIHDSAVLDDLNLATKVSVQLQLTDPDLKSRDRVVRKSEKNSLYAAMDLSAVWLDRALANN